MARLETVTQDIGKFLPVACVKRGGNVASKVDVAFRVTSLGIRIALALSGIPEKVQRKTTEK